MDPKDYQCYYCKEKGHFARNCPKKEEEEAGESKEAAVVEPTKPRALMAAWEDEVSGDEAGADAVPDNLCLMGKPYQEEDDEVSEELFLAKVTTLDQKGCVKLIMKLRKEREDLIKNLDEKEDLISIMTEENNEWGRKFDELEEKSQLAAPCKKCPVLETQFLEIGRAHV